ncbi:MAG TPA: SGNH/GDSL hydrolase family protein [Thermoanaerobaculia bacterium]|nr:SGNH/GDSL hydrolase family protein [Thermoanaerobaculia bacterium]
MTSATTESPPAAGRFSRAKRFLARAAITLLVACVGGEIAVRAVEHFRGPTGSLYSLIVPWKNRFKLLPHAQLIVPERYGDIEYRINRDGYRDEDRDPAVHRRRIVLLGDSVAFGLGVAQDRTFAAGLARELRQRASPPVELVNLAIFAYHSGNELDALREDGLRYAPEAVILQFYLNDLGTPPRAIRNGPPPPPPGLAARLISLKNRFLYDSALYRRLNQLASGLSFRLFHGLRRHRWPESLNADEPRGDLANLAAHPDDAAIPAFQAIREIRDLAVSHGARFLLVLSPDEVQLFTRAYDGINDRLHRFCRTAGIECVDLLAELRSRADKAELFYDGVHYSPLGHKIVARRLLEELARRGMIRGFAPDSSDLPAKAAGR